MKMELGMVAPDNKLQFSATRLQQQLQDGIG